MGRTRHRLTAVEIRANKKPGYYPDGGGLCLRVSPSKTKGWIFRYTLRGKTRDMGLGAVGLGTLAAVSLAAARERADRCRQLVSQRIDPIEERREREAAQKANATKARTFDECWREYVDTHEAAWRNATHRAQWSGTLKAYVSPVFGRLSVGEVNTDLVMKAIRPIWATKPETASRVRGRIEAVLDWAKVRGLRQGENPARWRGHLDHLLPKKTKVRKVEHYPALRYPEIGSFMSDLAQQRGTIARALEFVILTAARRGEVLGAHWNEIDLEERIWTVPPERIKGGVEHRVPLSPQAVWIVKGMREVKINDYVFPGRKGGRSFSGMAMPILLRRMNRGDLTAHGFRSTFRDWAAECTNFPNHVVEQALAHVISDKVEAAYRRGDLFEKRRKLMEAWGQFCSKPQRDGTVIPMARAQDA